MSNPNEYIEDGKIYIKEMKTCIVESIKCGEYQLMCNIHQRGKKGYVYKPWEEGFISRVEKRLWLSDWARMQIAFAIDEYEAEVKAFKEAADHFRTENIGLDVWLAPNPDGSCSYLFEYCNDNVESASRIFKKSAIIEILSDMRDFIKHNTDVGRDCPHFEHITRVNSPDELQYNPLYKYAVDTGDELIQLKIKLLFHQETDEESNRYSELTDRKILPKLPSEYDKNYVVFTDEVDAMLLRQSGYDFPHVPNIAMRGKTRRKAVINPYVKVCKDAAPVEIDAIHFEEFLDLFNKKF